jgi:hypothetical protein
MTQPLPISGWSYEGPDPSVGIFGDTFVHEKCTVEYDLGVEATETLGFRDGDYVQYEVQLQCKDCGQEASFPMRDYDPIEPDED